jgi:hypothetical protein
VHDEGSSCSWAASLILGSPCFAARRLMCMLGRHTGQDPAGFGPQDVNKACTTADNLVSSDHTGSMTDAAGALQAIFGTLVC